MSLLILFRKTVTVNRYHRLIIDSIRTGIGDEVIICSGFFQEDRNFSASMDTDLACSICHQKIKLTTIGIHNQLWKNRYKIFRDNFKRCKISINALIAKDYHWHAKIFILKKNGNPIFGIIGSSNMTRPAFGYNVPFNFEADVVLWDKSCQQIDSLCQSQTELQNENNNGFIYADYNLARNRNISSMDKLREIELELFSRNLIELE